MMGRSESGVVRLQQALEVGSFAITAEVMPPRGGSVGVTLAHAQALRGLVHAINVTDGGLLPTPTACIANDGETPSTWLDRRERVKLTAKNGNGMGMPLTIAAQMLPTPVARDYKGPGRADQLPTVLTPTGMNM